jgi:hypothetical protein
VLRLTKVCYSGCSCLVQEKFGGTGVRVLTVASTRPLSTSIPLCSRLSSLGSSRIALIQAAVTRLETLVTCRDGQIVAFSTYLQDDGPQNSGHVISGCCAQRVPT